ncbi:SGNH/GDSL hydrolase family protein [Neobacillus rhizophilus]|uniref:SGNH/GDSL hydrolase family protein n=1 Tax=Neobacillus rhizophilus TaxID=2833579 RepID=A0A942U6S2_9BACI|nr:SGNH/GDSL hydrolase family protein [Neobacillus rhizophilus]MBS4213713.1 SGNH/GDSL hydrolase family protein [Neobacillus rhizophilus]MBU8917882.1 SGNH/GDSL hydrolase family protein [Bacillus sp. FJAT-29953]
MKRRIVCFGDSNTWGYDAKTLGRFPEGIRWTSILADLLGEEFQVVEEGLSGRTSVVDDPLFEGLNGYDYIHPCLMSHSPLELVIIMLGTNDTKERFHLTSYNIAQGIARLSQKAKSSPAGVKGDFPEVLVIAPPPIGIEYYETEVGKSMGKDCDIKSTELSAHLEELMWIQKTEFLDTKGIVPMNHIDYMHLDEEGHRLLAELVFNKLQTFV